MEFGCEPAPLSLSIESIGLSLLFLVVRAVLERPPIFPAAAAPVIA